MLPLQFSTIRTLYILSQEVHFLGDLPRFPSVAKTICSTLLHSTMSSKLVLINDIPCLPIEILSSDEEEENAVEHFPEREQEFRDWYGVTVTGAWN